MKELPNLQSDIEEIFLHVKKIKEEQDNISNEGTEDLNPIQIIKDTTGISTEESDFNIDLNNDLFEIVKPSQNITLNMINSKEQSFSEINTEENMGICDLCSSNINFEDNLSGLVINEEFFACEKCCKESSKEDLENWIKSKMISPTEVKPIALWLMEKNNKTKLF